MFEALGLIRTEERVYLHLLRKGPASITSVVVDTGLTRRNVEAAVERLNTLGLVSTLRQERLMAVPFEIGVEHLIQQRRRDLETVRHTALRLGAEMQGRSHHHHDDQVTILRRDDVSAVRHQLLHSAQEELRILVRSPAFGEDLPDSGPAYRVVQNLSIEQFPPKEAQIRLASEVPADLALADRNSALLPLETTALVVRPGNLFDALEALFDAVWLTATPFADGPDEQDLELLSLLVAGLTDDAAGARLGMSRRTVARRVQRLMQVTGAHSRLQLGWWAREREWLS